MTKARKASAAPAADRPAREHGAPAVDDRHRPTPKEHAYLVARATNRAGGLAGMAKVGMLASLLSTLGLKLLRRKGKAKAGAALLATAAGLSLLRRKEP